MRGTAIALWTTLAACTQSTTAPVNAPPVSATPRAFRMGFSGFPPAPDLTRAVQSLELWMPRADAAIIHVEPKWAALLAGESVASVAHREFDGLVAAYRARNLEIVVVIDATNGTDRTSEAAELVAAGRSITEPAIQALYRAWARALVAQIQPVGLGLAAETNLIRLAAPARVYAALRQMTADAARDVRADAPTLPLFITVQTETAWGRLQGTNAYLGVEQDFLDFPFTQWLGYSSYPYLGKFTEPEQVPTEWFTRLLGGRTLPTLVTEGGWTSATIGTIVSSPERQARWIRRLAQLADALAPRYVFQLQFTDLDLVAFDRPNDPHLLPFARLGLVDMTLGPKPALAEWDAVFARVRVRAR
jgi:hypothetical protein